jgi:hypothetical protein
LLTRNIEGLEVGQLNVAYLHIFALWSTLHLITDHATIILLCVVWAKTKLPFLWWAGLPTAWVGERLLVRCYALKTVSDD